MLAIFKSIDEFISFVAKQDEVAANKIKNAINDIAKAKNKEAIELAASTSISEARKYIPRTFLDNLTQIRYLCMLSSPRTHVKNIVSNIWTGTIGEVSGAVTKKIQDNLIKSGKVGEGYFKTTTGINVGAFNRAHKGALANIEYGAKGTDMIIRGTTPTITFDFPFDVSETTKFRMYFIQGKNVVLTKDETDCTISGNSVSVKLTQQETYKFSEKKLVGYKARFKLGNDVFGTIPKNTRVEGVDEASSEVL